MKFSVFNYINKVYIMMQLNPALYLHFFEPRANKSEALHPESSAIHLNEGPGEASRRSHHKWCQEWGGNHCATPPCAGAFVFGMVSVFGVVQMIYLLFFMVYKKSRGVYKFCKRAISPELFFILRIGYLQANLNCLRRSFREGELCLVLKLFLFKVLSSEREKLQLLLRKHLGIGRSGGRWVMTSSQLIKYRNHQYHLQGRRYYAPFSSGEEYPIDSLSWLTLLIVALAFSHYQLDLVKNWSPIGQGNAQAPIFLLAIMYQELRVFSQVNKKVKNCIKSRLRHGKLYTALDARAAHASVVYRLLFDVETNPGPNSDFRFPLESSQPDLIDFHTESQPLVVMADEVKTPRVTTAPRSFNVPRLPLFPYSSISKSSEMSSNITRWLRLVKTTAEVQQWTPAEVELNLSTLLQGSSAHFFFSLSDRERRDLPTVLDALEKHFTPQKSSDLPIMVFRARQGINESVTDFYWRLHALFSKAFPTMRDDTERNHLFKDIFIKGLPVDVQRRVAPFEYPSALAALESLQKLESRDLALQSEDCYPGESSEIALLRPINHPTSSTVLLKHQPTNLASFPVKCKQESSSGEKSEIISKEKESTVLVAASASSTFSLEQKVSQLSDQVAQLTARLSSGERNLNLNSNSVKNKETCQYCEKTGHNAKICFKF
jgi:hypothetical protein